MDRFVVEALVKFTLSMVTFVNDAFVAKKFVDVAFVITDEVANMFCEKRLRKRRELEPMERTTSVVGRRSARKLRVL